MEFDYFEDYGIVIGRIFSPYSLKNGTFITEKYITINTIFKEYHNRLYSLNIDFKRIVDVSEEYKKLYLYFVKERGTGPYFLPVGQIVCSPTPYEEMNDEIHFFNNEYYLDAPIQKTSLIPVTSENMERCLCVILSRLQDISCEEFGVNFTNGIKDAELLKGVYKVGDYAGANLFNGKMFPIRILLSIKSNLYNVKYKGFISYLYKYGDLSYKLIENEKIRNLFETVLKSNDVEEECIKYILGETDDFPGKIKIDYSSTSYSRYVNEYFNSDEWRK